MRELPVQMIPLSQIVNKFDVRIKLDEDRVVQFAGFYQDGMDLPPVKLVKLAEEKYAYIDGRTRGAARAYLDMADVPAIVATDAKSQVELFVEALKDNCGGAKPPTRDDITHTVTRMLECGASQTSCRDYLSFLPPGSVKAYISSARSTITKRKIARALDDIASGYSVDQAAKRTAIPVETLKDVVAGKKGKWGHGRSNEAEFAIAMKSYISRELRSTNTGISKKIQDMLGKVENGEISGKLAADVIKAWSEHLRKTMIRIKDWDARLEAISIETSRATEDRSAA